MACSDLVSSGAAVSGGRVFFNTLDAQTIALDAATGRELWRAKLGDITHGETMAMAPLVVRDKVIVGNAGGGFGVRHPDRNGYLYVLDRATGKVLTGRPVRTRHHVDARRPRDRPAGLRPGEGAAHRHDGPRHLTGVARRQGLATVGVVAARLAAPICRTRTSSRTPRPTP